LRGVRHARKFREFLKKRAHLLLFVGALIVFFTFVIKKGIVEHWKDTVNELTETIGDANALACCCSQVQCLPHEFCFSFAHSIPATCRSIAAKGGRPIGVSQSIRFDPFSSLHHQCVAWILSG
jgi:hypothetical protein